MVLLRISVDGDALRTPLSGVGYYVFNLCSELEKLLPEASFIAYSRLPPGEVLLPSSHWQLRSEPVALLRRLPSFIWLKTPAVAPCAHPMRWTYSGPDAPCIQDLPEACVRFAPCMI